MKKVTGHRSDAVNCYQITFDDQQEKISKVLAGQTDNISEENVVETEKSHDCKTGSEIFREPTVACKCTCEKHIGINIGQIVNETVSKNIKEGTTVIKLEIEFTH